MKDAFASCSWWHWDNQRGCWDFFFCLLLLMFPIYRARLCSLPYPPIPHPSRGPVCFPGKGRERGFPHLKAVVHINPVAIAVSQGARNWNSALPKETASLTSEPGDGSECDLLQKNRVSTTLHWQWNETVFHQSVWLTAGTLLFVVVAASILNFFTLFLPSIDNLSHHIFLSQLYLQFK